MTLEPKQLNSNHGSTIYYLGQVIHLSVYFITDKMWIIVSFQKDVVMVKELVSIKSSEQCLTHSKHLVVLIIAMMMSVWHFSCF